MAHGNRSPAAAGLIVVALLLGGCGEKSAPTARRPSPATGAVVASRASGPPAGRPSSSGETALAGELGREMRRAGRASGAYVYDVSAGRALFAAAPDIARTPASVEKLYTSVAALERLGPSARFDTTVLGRGSRSADGVWHGDLYLRGGGDPTFGSPAFNAVYTEGQGALITTLVSELTGRDGLRRVTGGVYADESLFDSRRGGPTTGYAADEFDLGGELSALSYNHGTVVDGARRARGRGRPGPKAALAPGASAVLRFVEGLRGAHVSARATQAAVATPADATVLARVSSPALPEVLSLMNRPSDDFYAEMLVKQLGVRTFGVGSLPAGARAISGVLSQLGVHARVTDGSGLSRADATTPREVTQTLVATARTPLFADLRDSLAVVGRSGTLATRMRHTPAAGRCQAKTGTLVAVSTLAGYCLNRHGHLLAFSFLLSGQSSTLAHRLQDDMTITLARDDPARP